MWWMLAAAFAEPPKNVVLADLGLHVIGLGYQRTVAPRLALQGDLDLWVPWTSGNYGIGALAGTSDVAGMMLRFRPVWHMTGDAPTGLWLSPVAQAGPVTATRAGEKVFGVGGSVGMNVGYSGVVAQHLFLSIGGGAQVHGAWIGRGRPSFIGVWPNVDATIGYAW
jgi:hypothetical protein